MKLQSLIRSNFHVARTLWGPLSRTALKELKEISESRLLSVASGELSYIEGRWYVSHAGLLRIAERNRCSGIEVQLVSEYCNPSVSRWAFKATVFKSARCKGFVGYGDADPSNTSPLVRGAELRIAETRAVGRALRKAYGIGICSVEELGSFSGPLPSAGQMKDSTTKVEPENGNGHHPLRDRLYLLIRQHRLDAALVKTYAADYCDVAELRQASREQVAQFIKHLAEYAQADREGLLCQLNSYGASPPTPALVQITPASSSDEPEEAGVA